MARHPTIVTKEEKRAALKLCMIRIVCLLERSNTLLEITKYHDDGGFQSVLFSVQTHDGRTKASVIQCASSAHPCPYYSCLTLAGLALGYIVAKCHAASLVIGYFRQSSFTSASFRRNHPRHQCTDILLPNPAQIPGSHRSRIFSLVDLLFALAQHLPARTGAFDATQH